MYVVMRFTDATQRGSVVPFVQNTEDVLHLNRFLNMDLSHIS